MPRRQQQIAADKVVATKVFADTISGSAATETPAVGTYVFTQADSGKTFFLIAGAVNFTIPVIADLTAGWHVNFKATAAWTGTVTAQTAILVGPITAAGALENLSAQNTIASGTVAAGDFFSVTFDGTNLLVAGTGTAASYIT